jgi:hypothetical protein
MEVSPKIFLWIVVVVIGGALGAWSGGFRLTVRQLRYLITAVLLIACMKLFII